jgi:hypothetical protein
MIGPTATEERALVLRRRFKLKGEHLKTRWISNGPVLTVVFFVLTLMGASAASGFLLLIGMRSTIVLGLLAIALSEFLMLRMNFFSTGVESALWIAGIVGVITGLPGQPGNETALVFAAGAAMAGFRVRSPLFGTAAVALILVYVGLEAGWIPMAVVSMIVSLLAMVALRFEVQRPSTEWLLIFIAIGGCIGAGVVTLIEVGDRLWPWWIVYGALALFLGLRFRHHAPMICAFGGIAVFVVEAHRWIAMAPEAKFAIGGAILVGIATLVSRALRDKTTGIVMTPEKFTGYDDMLETAATVALAPAPAVAAPAPRPAGEGSFGGAGATGEF